MGFFKDKSAEPESASSAGEAAQGISQGISHVKNWRFQVQPFKLLCRGN